MTCLIAAKNSEYSILASDTWNRTKNEENHVIRKIAFGEGIIIGQAGLNMKVTPDGHFESIYNLMKKWCEIYNILNVNGCMELFETIAKDFDLFMRDLNKVEECQIIVIINDYYFKNNHIFKYYAKSQPNSEEKVFKNFVKDKAMNALCTSWGSHSDDFNYEHKDTDFEGASKIDLIDTVTGFVQRQINQEINIESNERTVGGSVEYCIMDNDGNIETNFG